MGRKMNKTGLNYYDIYGFILAVDKGMKKAFGDYIKEVKEVKFPDDNHSFH